MSASRLFGSGSSRSASQPRRLHCSQTAFVIILCAIAVLAAMASKSNSASTLVTPGISPYARCQLADLMKQLGLKPGVPYARCQNWAGQWWWERGREVTFVGVPTLLVLKKWFPIYLLGPT
jgi:hypothetical protein